MENKFNEDQIYNYVALYDNDKKLKLKWQKEGFVLAEETNKYIWDEDISHALILEKAIEELHNFSNIKNKEIKDVSDCIGSYGMGGLGYFGLKYHHENFLIWIVIDCDDVDFFMDNRPFTVRTRKEADKTNPWYRGYVYHPERTKNIFYDLLKTMTIIEMDYDSNTLTIKLKDKADIEHKIYTSKGAVRGIYTIIDGSKIFRY